MAIRVARRCSYCSRKATHPSGMCYIHYKITVDNRAEHRTARWLESWRWRVREEKTDGLV